MKNLKQGIISILIGLLFMLFAIAGQVFVQELPLLILIYSGITPLKAIKIITNFAYSNIIIYSIFMGGVAGAFQESFKYIAVDTKSKEFSFWIGLGFSIVDILFLLIEEYKVFLNITLVAMVIIFLNILFSLLFHPGTAMFLKGGILNSKGSLYLIIAFIIHTIVDGGLVFVTLFVIKHPEFYILTTSIYWLLIMLVAILIFLYGKKILKNAKEENFKDITVF